ncbi:S1 family peptidase [Paludisphaera mucosa]|uniref:Serine protease n=1 Tax=Paludisphaera mucosa TaxID=3030827 RepID=A0ABT6FCV4_9BACT|nr:serine protease [Paludisphaera mucosa]MDG3005397.1 serine protease [Paludisphaera mucosa]
MNGQHLLRPKMSRQPALALILGALSILGAAGPAHAQNEFIYFVTVKQKDPSKEEPRIVATQTGFRLRHIRGIVTALHGVLVSDATIEAVSEKGAKLTKPLTIVQVDVASDVAVLSSPEFSGLDAQGFEQATDVDWEALRGEKLTFIGHPKGVPRPTPDDVNVEKGPEGPLFPLTRLINEDLRDGFKVRKTPGLNVLMLPIHGNVFPGHSGAPVLDSLNRVVAVVDGGMDEKNIGWAVPWRAVMLREPAKDPLFQVYQDLLAVPAAPPAGGSEKQARDGAATRREIERNRRQYERDRGEEEVEYFASVVKRYGVPVGIGPLSPRQAQARAASYKFISRNGLVEDVEIVSGHGKLTINHGVNAILQPPTDGVTNKLECKYHYMYDQRRFLVEESARDRMGEVVWSLRYTNIPPTTGLYTDSAGFPRARLGSGAAAVVFSLTDEGFANEVRFVDRDGAPQTDSNGVFGLSYVLDASGQVTEATFLDETGNPVCCRDGYVKRRFTYDALGQNTSVSLLDEADRPATHKAGYARFTWTRDKWGNLVEEAFFDAEGRRALNADGYAVRRLTLDDWGEVRTEDYLGVDEKPIVQKHGYARVELVHDDRGYETSGTCFDAEGKPALDQFGFTKLAHTYDERGNMKKEEYFDVHGNRAVQKSGMASLTCGYDGRGNQAWMAFSGPDDRPTPNKDGYAKVTYTYSQDNKVVAETYLDVKDRPTQHRNGYASVARTYDNRGNRVSESYLDERGRATASKDGYARIECKFDARGNRVEEAYFGADGRPARHNNGYATLRARHNARGDVINETYFDTDGRAMARKEGVHEMRSTFDERGNRTGESYFDAGGSPTIVAEGFHEIRWEFDNRGNALVEAYFDASGRPTLGKRGYARCTRSFNNRGNILATDYLGVGGEPVLHSDGYAGIRSTNDSRGNVIKELYLDTKGRPTLLNDGYASETWVYDNQSNPIQDAFWDTEGLPTITSGIKSSYAPVHRIQKEFDSRGNTTKVRNFDKEEKLTPSADGIAAIAAAYDARCNAVELTYLGADERPVINLTEGVAVVVETFDERGNTTSQSYLDVLRRPMPCPGGYIKLSKAYDDHGNVTEEAYWGPNGLVSHNGIEVARSESTYDAHGRVLQIRYFDPAGQPARHRLHGNAMVKYEYDTWGNITREDSYGVDGERSPNAGGVASNTRAYDRRGNQVEEAYFDPEGKRVVHSFWGYSRAVYAYDDRGTRVKATCLDAMDRELPTRIVVISVPDERDEAFGLRFQDALLSYKNENLDIVSKLVSRLRSEENWDQGAEVSILRNGQVENRTATPRMLLRAALKDEVVR